MPRTDVASKRAELVDAARTAELRGQRGRGRSGAVLYQHPSEPHSEKAEAIEQVRSILDGDVDRHSVSTPVDRTTAAAILGVVLRRAAASRPSENEVAFGEERRAEAEKSRDGHRRLAQPADLRDRPRSDRRHGSHCASR